MRYNWEFKYMHTTDTSRRLFRVNELYQEYRASLSIHLVWFTQEPQISFGPAELIGCMLARIPNSNGVSFDHVALAGVYISL